MPRRALFPLRPWLLALALLLVPACLGTARAGDRPFTIDDMLRVSMIDEVRLAGDGSRVAFTVTRVESDELRSRIHVAEAGKGLSRPVTPESEQCEKPRLSGDGARLAYLVQGDDETDLVLARADGGQPKKLLHGRFDILDMAFTPDGKALFLAMTAQPKSPGPRLDGCDAEVEILDAYEGATGLYQLSLAGHAAPRALVTDREVGGFAVSPDGRRVAYETVPPDTPPRGRRGAAVPGGPAGRDAAQSDIALVDLATGKSILLAATEDSETSPQFSPDGALVAYVATQAPGFYFNAARVMVVPASGGAPRALAQTPNARPELLGFSATGDAVYVREASGTGAVILALPVGGGPARPVSDTPHVVVQAELSTSAKALALVLTDSDLPPEVYLTAAGRFEPRPVSAINKAFTGLRLGKTEVVRWRAPDGVEIEGLYTHPVAPGSDPPPLLVELHGGPAVSADRQYLGALNYYPLAVFCERGYALFQPNVRGSDGYGADFRRASLGDWGGKDFADLQSGLDALVARKLADPERLGVMGWSYGGYLAAWAIGHTNRFKAASIGAGITNLVSQSGSMDLPDFIPLYFGGEAYERFDLLFDRSPLKYAAAIKTPTLFQHGVADERVPFTQSLELYTALSRLGVTTRLAAYPRSGHDVTEPALIRDLMTRNLDWFTRFVPAGQGASGALAGSPPSPEQDRSGS
ncbi:S9 family peptidase [Solidesulfovibrio sp.]|uniref:S9 family peptidase n=1 Tax=Solidesulfovibrio sp. TaxID=2910990 RepID=UPI002611E2E7|nr:S9 family peptidase [Solidesulfovibrio sp.]